MEEYLKEYTVEEKQQLEMRDATTDTIIAKVVAMCCLFLGSFALGILPVKLSQWLKWESKNKKSKNLAEIMLCFGGGVLICTIFFHLLPEVEESLNELIAKGHFPKTKINFTEMFMCIGFFTLYLVEECVHLYLHRREKSQEMKTFKRTLSIRRCEISSDDSSDAHSNSSANLVKVDEEHGTNFSKHELNPHEHDHKGHSHMIISDDSIVKSLRGLLVVLALSVHELFEGLTVGLESSSSNVWYMFAAVSVHKFVIAFCIGVELVTNKTKFVLTAVYVFIFAVVSPLGIGIGIAITVEKQESTALVSVILQGLASGTLIYVVFFEILQKDKSSGLIRYLSVLIGFLLMLCLTTFRIGIGIALREIGESQDDVVSVVLQGMAAGTLLYVVFFEVLARERSNRHSGIGQLIAIISGFIVMLGLQFITGHEHSHGGSESSDHENSNHFH